MPSNAANRIASCLHLAERHHAEPSTIQAGRDETTGAPLAYSFGELIAYDDPQRRGIWVRTSRDSTQATNRHISAAYEACTSHGLRPTRLRETRDGRPFTLIATPEAERALRDAEAPSSAELAATAGGRSQDRSLIRNRPDADPPLGQRAPNHDPLPGERAQNQDPPLGQGAAAEILRAQAHQLSDIWSRLSTHPAPGPDDLTPPQRDAYGAVLASVYQASTDLFRLANALDDRLASPR